MKANSWSGFAAQYYQGDTGVGVFHQGSSDPEDRKLTQDIRHAVMSDSSLSPGAKNVKITTNSGKVTLRGAVKTDRERAVIEAAAKKIAGANQVENLLELAN